MRFFFIKTIGNKCPRLFCCHAALALVATRAHHGSDLHEDVLMFNKNAQRPSVSEINYP